MTLPTSTRPSPRTANEIRAAFLGFFGERGHAAVHSSSLVPQNDPTLLFTNSGMVQFKDVFTGREKRPYTRATTAQKCVRAGGKHNDLENVGFTARHHTFFEMMGNFSFGDYFKPDAIAWAWEFVTQVLSLPADRLVVTVFEGDASVPADTEAEDLWKARGVRPERIFRLGRKDNFWQMGDTGPCGPCTELHVYRGPLTAAADIDAHARDFFSGKLGDTDDWMEIWNLVFMQFERFTDGTLTALPRPSVDTGAGLERLASAVQGVATNYDTDLLRGLCDDVGRLAGHAYATAPDADKASIRVIVDHSRSTAFLIADGVMPSNEGRGYVLRRIMRRAIRHGKRLGVEKVFFPEVCARVIETMGQAYPELRESAALIAEVVRNEEESFRRTLNRGLALLDEAFEAVPAGADKVLPGATVFRLYDTYGFPADLTRVIATERGFGIDEDGFEAEMERQRDRSTFAGSGEQTVGLIYKDLAGRIAPTQFTGYAETEAAGTVLALLVDGVEVESATAPATVEFIVDRTPFYAEGGGQLADAGTAESDATSLVVDDVQKPAGTLFVHKSRLTNGTLRRGQTIQLRIDAERRAGLRAHHSATHLLHHVLRQVLGEHVRQAGSIVAPDYLRFDFAHFASLTAAQLRDIETRVNRLVRENAQARTDELGLDEAKARGAMAFFGEKYGDRVRMLSIGPSVELCGGTHVSRTGDIGLFKITSESAIAAGVRRIVAVVGAEAVTTLHAQEQVLGSVAEQLRVAPKDAATRVEAVVLRMKELEKELESLHKAQAAARSGDLAAGAVDVGGGVKVLAARAPGDPKGLRELADKLRDKLGRGVIALGCEQDGKALLLVAVTKDLLPKVSAKVLLDEVAPLLGGRGGGKPDLAQAGGGDPTKLDAALARVADFARQVVQA